MIFNKGESTLGDLFIGVAIFIFVALGGFVFFFNSLAESGAVTSSSVEFATLNQSLNNISQDTEFIQNSSTETPSIAGLDILAMGWDSIKRIATMTTTGSNILNWIQTETPLSKLPRLFWDIVFIIMIITITFTLIGAVWRYKMKK